jgi:hypothetical protein
MALVSLFENMQAQCKHCKMELSIRVYFLVRLNQLLEMPVSRECKLYSSLRYMSSYLIDFCKIFIDQSRWKRKSTSNKNWTFWNRG